MSNSQNDIGNISNQLTPRGYQKINLDGNVKTLFPPNIDTPMIAAINSLNGIVRFRDDGVNPTGTSGQPIVNKLTINYFPSDLSLIKFIADDTDPATEINISYYSYSTTSEVKAPQFCLVQSYLDATLGGAQTYSHTVNSTGVFVSGEDTVGSATTNVSSSSTEQGFLSQTLNFQTEMTLASVTADGSLFIALTSDTPAGLGNLISGVQCNVDTGDIDDLVLGNIFAGVTMTPNNFVCSLIANPVTGDITFYYSEDNGATIAGSAVLGLLAPWDINEASYATFGIVTGGVINDAATAQCNDGEAAYKIKPVGVSTVGYCGK